MAQTPDKISQAGDVNIDDVSIITSAGFLQTITPQVIGIEIYEDMFAPFVTGKIFVKDSQELTNLLPLIGEEILRIKVTTPSLENKDAYQGEYYIYKMDDKLKVGEREMLYCLHFMSKEGIVDLNKKISKAYKGKISDIAKKILTESDGLETKKEINIEDTKNETMFVSNFWNPIKCLTYAASNAINTNDSPSYIFFENKYGFNFVSLETLYTGSPLKQRFVWDNYSAVIQDTGGSGQSVEEDYQRVMEFQHPEPFNYIDRIKSGMYGSEIIYYDLLSQQYVHKGYGPDFNDHKHLNDHPLWTDKIAARSKAVMYYGKKYYNNFDNFDDVTNTTTIQMRNSLLAQAEGYKVIISVLGRTDYSAGQKVYLEVPRSGQIANKDDEWEDKIVSGTYLVGAICHFINREKHECTMELIKDSHKAPLNDTSK